MITPEKPSAKAKPLFAVCDIENDLQGNVLDVGLTFRHKDEIVHRVFDGWETFLDFIYDSAKHYPQFRTIYAHNGGQWDWCSLAHFILTEGKQPGMRLEVVRATSRMIMMRLKRGDGKHTIKFCDSLYLLRSNLDQLGKVMLGRGKAETGGDLPHVIKKRDPAAYYEYLRTDCELLLLCLETALNLIHTQIAKVDRLGTTIGSTAMKIFRTGFVKEEISVPLDSTQKEFLREGYRGGRVEVFRSGYYDKINVYDINSLYPAAMVSVEYPISGAMEPSGTVRFNRAGIYRVKFSQTNRRVAPVLMADGSGVYDGEGVYFTPELRLLREIGADIECLGGYDFPDVGEPFKEYVDTLYKFRLKDKNGALGLLAKYLLNSLYGKFAQRSDQESLEYLTEAELDDRLTKYQTMRIEREETLSHWHYKDDQHKEKMIAAALNEIPRIQTLNLDYGIFIVRERTDVAFEHVGIAGMITSQARVLLYRGLHAAGFNRVVYCDTDSVHTTGLLPSELVDETTIGKFKHEFSGEGVYCGKKLYALRKGEKEKVRAKGVSVGGKYGCDLRFDGMVRILKGEVIKCNFSQPATITQVLTAKDTPCRIGAKGGGHNRTRRLRRLVK